MIITSTENPYKILLQETDKSYYIEKEEEIINSIVDYFKKEIESEHDYVTSNSYLSQLLSEYLFEELFYERAEEFIDYKKFFNLIPDFKLNLDKELLQDFLDEIVIEIKYDLKINIQEGKTVVGILPSLDSFDTEIVFDYDNEIELDNINFFDIIREMPDIMFTKLIKEVTTYFNSNLIEIVKTLNLGSAIATRLKGVRQGADEFILQYKIKDTKEKYLYIKNEDQVRNLLINYLISKDLLLSSDSNEGWEEES